MLLFLVLVVVWLVLCIVVLCIEWWIGRVSFPPEKKRKEPPVLNFKFYGLHGLYGLYGLYRLPSVVGLC